MFRGVVGLNGVDWWCGDGKVMGVGVRNWVLVMDLVHMIH